MADRTITIFYAYRFLSSFFLIGPVITLFLLEFIPFSQLGFLFAIGVATAFVFEIPSGAWADRFGRRYVIAAGSLFAALELALIAYGQSFGYFFAAAIFGGIAYALVSGADTALVYDRLVALGREKESRKVYGRARAIRYVSVVIAALIGAPLYAVVQTTPFYANAIIMVGAALLILFAREPEVRVHARGWREEVSLIRNGFSTVSSNPRLVWVIAFSVFSGLGVWLYHDLFKLPYLEGIGYPIAWLGVVIAIVTIIRSVVSWHAHRVESWLGDKTIIVLLTVPGVLLMLMGFFPSLFALIFIIVLYMVWSVQEVVAEATLHEHIPSAQRATIYSIHSFANTAMLFVGALSLAFIADASFHGAIIASGAASLVIGLAIAARA